MAHLMNKCLHWCAVCMFKSHDICTMYTLTCNSAQKIRCGWAHFNDLDASGPPVNSISKSILTMIRCWCWCCRYFCWSCHTKTMIQITLDDNYIMLQCVLTAASVCVLFELTTKTDAMPIFQCAGAHTACNNVNVNNNGRLQSCFTLLWT